MRDERFKIAEELRLYRVPKPRETIAFLPQWLLRFLGRGRF